MPTLSRGSISLDPPLMSGVCGGSGRCPNYPRSSQLPPLVREKSASPATCYLVVIRRTCTLGHLVSPFGGWEMPGLLRLKVLTLPTSCCWVEHGSVDSLLGIHWFPQQRTDSTPPLAIWCWWAPASSLLGGGCGECFPRLPGTAGTPIHSRLVFQEREESVTPASWGYWMGELSL